MQNDLDCKICRLPRIAIIILRLLKKNLSRTKLDTIFDILFRVTTVQ